MNENKQTVLTDTLHAAIDLLTQSADDLRDCHTISTSPDDWTGEPEAKAEYDRILQVVDALSKLRAAGEPSDAEIMAIVREQCPGFDDAHEGPDQDDMIRTARALLSRYGRPAGDAQSVAAQETYPQMMPAELSQFLSDVMTAAGLVSHGKQCKALGERLGDACMRLRRHYQEPFAAPVAAQKADDALRTAVKTAYGYLWHVNNEPGTPNQYAPERAAYEARKMLRAHLTKDERGEGINAARAAIAQQRQGEGGE